MSDVLKMLKKPILLFNTLKYLKPIQRYALVRSKLAKGSFTRGQYVKPYNMHMNTSLKTVIPELDLDPEYYYRFKPDLILEGKFTFLNETRGVNLSSWKVADSSHLWNYNLHYFEFAIALGALYKRTQSDQWYKVFKEILISWMNNNDNKNDAWKPYTISLRIPNLLISLELFDNLFQQDVGFKQEVVASIYNQYNYLEKNKELHLLGNHYFENLKTCILCNILFNEKEKLNKNIRALKIQIEDQILPDGMHFERSVMYHKVILEDLIRIAFWFEQINKNIVKELRPVLQKMLNCTVSLEKGMGKMPLFNDAGDGVAKETYQLVDACRRLFGIKPEIINIFPDSGYTKLYSDDIAVMLDCGLIGPDYMPGHGHCDALSFELSNDGTPIFVNSGTYHYQTQLRGYFRSTQAHNTILINNKQQSECWGEHRVARRISNVKIALSDDRKSAIGSYINYCGNKHQRKIGFCAPNTFLVVDKVKSRKQCNVQSILHIHPNFSYRKTEENFEVIDCQGRRLCVVHPLNVDDITIHQEGELSLYADEFGHLQRKEALEMQWSSNELFGGYFITFHDKYLTSNEAMKHVASWCDSLKNF